MSATYNQLEAALLAPFVSVSDGGLGEWSATDIVAYDNVDFDTNEAQGKPWLRISVNGGSRHINTMGFEYRGNPVVTIEAHIPLGWGKSLAWQIIDAAENIYHGRTFTVDNSTLIVRSISQPMQIPSDGWYKLAIQISFNQF